MALIQPGRTALGGVARRLLGRKEELARRIVDRYRQEIVGWQDVEESVIASAREFTIRNIESLVGGLESDEPVPDQLLETAREVAARRVHQGVSFEALMHSGRMWGETLWEAVLAETALDQPQEREAALAIAGRLWRHVDVLSTAMAHAYLDEVTDRGLLGRDLLDALLAGRGESQQASRLARILRFRLAESHVVVLVRGTGVPVDNSIRGPLTTQIALDHIVAATRTQLRPTAGSLLVGMRQGDVVALYPAAAPEELDRIRHECAELVNALTVDVSVGMSGWHRGRAAIATAYAEARAAVDIAAGTGIRGRAVVLDDVLVDHMLRECEHARRILYATLEPLVEYDREHRSGLVATLRAYLASGANMTRSAAMLTVHPNTVVYRLRRIRELSGRDPHDMEDLQILFLALKLSELDAGRPDAA